MSDTPKGYHDAEVWLQVEGKTRASTGWERAHEDAGPFAVDSIKVKRLTQNRTTPDKGCIAVKVTLRIPDGAFLPFSPEAVITVPENMVVRGPIEADVVGDEKLAPHDFVKDTTGNQPEDSCAAFGTVEGSDHSWKTCNLPVSDPIHSA